MFVQKIVSIFTNDYSVAASVTTDFPSRADWKILTFYKNPPFEKPSVKAVLMALDWRRRLEVAGFDDIDVFPGHSGEILLSAIRSNLCFELTVEPDSTVSVSYERGDDVVFNESRVSLEEAKLKLAEVVREIWISSVGCIRYSSTNEKIGSPVLPSRIHPMMTAAYP